MLKGLTVLCEFVCPRAEVQPIHLWGFENISQMRI
jgi:hypothetical protein